MFEQVIDLEKQNWPWNPFEKYMKKMVISCENPSLTFKNIYTWFFFTNPSLFLQHWSPLSACRTRNNSKFTQRCTWILYCFLGGKDAVSSGFGYFMSAAVVLSLCLVSYLMLHRLVSRLYYKPLPFNSQEQSTSIFSQQY